MIQLKDGSKITITTTDYVDDSIVTRAATRSGNTAYGVGTFKHKVLFVTTATYDIDISLTCDTYGNVN